MKKSTYFWLRLCIGCIAIAVVVSRFSLSELSGVFAAFPWAHAAIALGLVFVGVAVSTYKWKSLINARGHVANYGILTRLYLEGIFFNNFLPTSIGGDIHRAYQLGKHTSSPAESVATVFLERLSGFMALSVFAVIGLADQPALRKAAPILTPVAALALLVSIGVWVAVLNTAFAQVLHNALSRAGLPGVADRMGRLTEAVSAYRHHPRVLWTVFLLSLVFNVTSVAAVYLLVIGAGVESITFATMTAILPIIVMIAAVPVTVNGLGVQEGGFVYLLGVAGAPAPKALAVALLTRLITVVPGIVGGFLWILLDKRRAPDLGD